MTLTAKTLLAGVSFELVDRPVSPFKTNITIDQPSTIFPDSTDTPTCSCYSGSNSTATETINNAPPHASFTVAQIPANDPSCVPITGANCTAYAYTFDASGSTDDLAVASYSWDFGDGTTDTADSSATVIHDFGFSAPGSVPGILTVTLHVTDGSGATGAARDSTGTPVSNNQPSHGTKNVVADAVPVAAFIFTPSTPSPTTPVFFDGRTSSDSDGTVVKYYWDFGDGSLEADTVATTTHMYSSCTSPPCTETVDLIVQDDAGVNSTATGHSFTVKYGNPTASFTFTPTSPEPGALVNFDGSASTQPAGTIASYIWDFDDGSPIQTFTTQTVTHTFTCASPPCTFTVTLNVTDNFGVKDSTSRTVVVANPNQPPTVSSLSTSASPTAGQTVTLTISASDPDGSISSITVDWGDGKTDNLSGSSTNPTHTYTDPGTYTVNVTVTDNGGLTAQKTLGVTVAQSSSTNNLILYVAIAAAIVALGAILVAWRRRSKMKNKPAQAQLAKK